MKISPPTSSRPRQSAALLSVCPLPDVISQVGSIPVQMSLVGAAVRELASNPTHNCLPAGRVTELQLTATCLTRLSEHDECAAQIRACNGVTLLGKLLLVQPVRGEGRLLREAGLGWNCMAFAISI